MSLIATVAFIYYETYRLGKTIHKNKFVMIIVAMGLSLSLASFILFSAILIRLPEFAHINIVVFYVLRFIWGVLFNCINYAHVYLLYLRADATILSTRKRRFIMIGAMMYLISGIISQIGIFVNLYSENPVLEMIFELSSVVCAISLVLIDSLLAW